MNRNKRLYATESILETSGMVLGKDHETKEFVSAEVRNPVRYGMLNQNVFACGDEEPRREFLLEQILQSAIRGESLFVASESLDFYEKTGAFLQSLGYRVFLYDTVERDRSNGIDIFRAMLGKDSIEENMDRMDLFVDLIFSASGIERHNYIDDIEKVLLKAICLYVLARYPEEKQNFGTVCNLIRESSKKELDGLFSDLSHAEDSIGRMAYDIYNTIRKIKPQMDRMDRDVFQAGLLRRLAIFCNVNAQRMVSAPDICMENLPKEKTAVFLIGSRNVYISSFLTKVMAGLSIVKITEGLWAGDREKQISVHLIYDGVDFLPVDSGFESYLMRSRERNLNYTVSVDSMSDLIRSIQGEYASSTAEAIFSFCDTKILFPCHDPKTAAYYSHLAGFYTMEGVPSGKTKKTLGRKLKSLMDPKIFADIPGKKMIGENFMKRDIYTVEELLRMEHEDVIVFMRGELPVLLKQFHMVDDPKSLLLLSNPVCKEFFSVPILVGKERDNLMKEVDRLKLRYQKERTFPNGMPIEVFFE